MTDELNPSNYTGYLVASAIGAVVGAAVWSKFAQKERLPPPKRSRSDDEESSDDDGADESDPPVRRSVRERYARGEYKLVLCVRTDLKMRPGKIAAQCGHAAVGAYQEAPEEFVSRWLGSGQAKIAVKCESEDQLLQLRAHAQALGVPTHVVVDAGRTQIAPNSRTVLAVGPGPVEMINQVTGHLKLL